MLQGMSLLRFSVGNYRSIKEVVTLDLAPSLGNTTELKSAAETYTQPVTAIFGPNASGKSNLLDAMRFAIQAITRSATTWRNAEDYPVAPHFPFSLNEEMLTQPSFFEFDFTIEQTRYLYGFTFGTNGVDEEWLSYVPKRRWSKCFNRTKGTAPEFDWNESFANKTSQQALGNIHNRELVLSVAFRDGHPILGPIARGLVNSFDFLPLGDYAQSKRIRQLTSLIHRGKFELDEISSLMQAADTGIESVQIDETKISPTLLKKLRRIIATLQDEHAEKESLSSDEIEQVIYSLVFTHAGTHPRKLRLDEESAGTLAWLSIAPNLIQSLRTGSVLVADELDSSLHQNLVEMIIKSFTDPSINQHGAQLILTSHNTNIIQQLRDLSLTTDTIWFIDKNIQGESSLFSLADFPNRAEANYERRYLAGIYGALPRLSPSTLRGLVTQEA